MPVSEEAVLPLKFVAIFSKYSEASSDFKKKTKKKKLAANQATFSGVTGDFEVNSRIVKMLTVIYVISF